MKTLLYILLLFPLYVVFNNLIFNLAGVPFSDYYIYIKGYLCRIDNFSANLQYHFLLFWLTRLGLLIFCFVFFTRLKKLVLAFVLYDLLAVISWIADNYTGTHFFSLFSSVHSTFYLSNHALASPILLHILEVVVFLVIVLFGKRKQYLYQNRDVFLYSLASVIIFQMAFTIYHLLT